MTPLAIAIDPVAEASTEPRFADYEQMPTSVSTRVLVLDASNDRRALLADVVTRAGGEASFASSGAEAIERLGTRRPQCLLVGGLPDGSRRAFIAWARPRFPDVAIVAIADQREHATELYNAGADDIALAPIDADLLGAKLAAAVRSVKRLWEV
jgi:DNA-binding response OmpR family regulator